MRLTRVTILILLALLISPVAGAPPVTTDSPLRAPELSRAVSCQAVGRPLEDALAQLSQGAPFLLKAADSATRNQRVTILVRNQTVRDVMRNVVALLSHGKRDGAAQYHWERDTDAGKAGATFPTFLLKRDPAARLAETEAHEQPFQDALQGLKEARDLAALTPEKRKDYPVRSLTPGAAAKIDNNVTAHALRGVSDERMERLMRGEPMTIPVAPLKEVMQRLHYGNIEIPRKRGDARAFPPFEMPDEANITFWVRGDNIAEEPECSPIYTLSMAYGEAADLSRAPLGGQWLNGYDEAEGIGLLPEKDNPAAKVYDLSKAFAKGPMSRWQRGDISLVLAQFAEVAGIQIYQEHFLKRPRGANDENPGPSWPLSRTKGTIPELANAISQAWGYRVERVGDDYYFWSRSWAFDRQSDVAEAPLNRWRKRIERQKGALTVWNRIALAGEFRWNQFAVTLPAAFPKFGRRERRRQYESMRVVSQMSDAEREAAMSEQGIPLASLSVEARRAIQESNLVPVRPAASGAIANAPAAENFLSRVRVRLYENTWRVYEPAPFDPTSLTVVPGADAPL